jgi:hypothetical protein
MCNTGHQTSESVVETLAIFALNKSLAAQPHATSAAESSTAIAGAVSGCKGCATGQLASELAATTLKNTK